MKCLQQDPEKVAKRRTEKKERSAVLKEKIIKMIESGLQLSEYQARKAFTVYLQCILQVDHRTNNHRKFFFLTLMSLFQRLSDFDDESGDPSQIDLVLKFLQKVILMAMMFFFNIQWVCFVFNNYNTISTNIYNLQNL